MVVIGVRANGQKVLLAVKSMGGESAEAWRTVPDDLIKRGLRRPEFLIVDGAAGLDVAIATVWDGVPVKRSTVHYAELRIMPASAAKPVWAAVIAVKEAASVPHDLPTAIRSRAVSVAGKKFRHLGLDRLREQRTRSLT